ncbi:conserved hypothetical protein [Candidatus Nitrotoga sp. BS]|uniref:hypothetical protein n=1 Tax=Candidatus Nitrotoga sp. BS TaxID=2890408 RepID=UPI001EF2522F|nr:hypothetical protein [Candidatus Nitrotoga sp. BS]CAH1211671.1 conserved hypothetical protein [Candidatus Nitrotoga sp. BS]
MNENQTEAMPSADRDVPYTDAVVQLTGEDGNAFLILGRVRLAILKSNHPELAEAFLQEAMKGDYDHLLQTCLSYVSVE